MSLLFLSQQLQALSPERSQMVANFLLQEWLRIAATAYSHYLQSGRGTLGFSFRRILEQGSDVLDVYYIPLQHIEECCSRYPDIAIAQEVLEDMQSYDPAEELALSFCFEEGESLSHLFLSRDYLNLLRQQMPLFRILSPQEAYTVAESSGLNLGNGRTRVGYGEA